MEKFQVCFFYFVHFVNWFTNLPPVLARTENIMLNSRELYVVVFGVHLFCQIYKIFSEC
jgi:hypothetical protein